MAKSISKLLLHLSKLEQEDDLIMIYSECSDKKGSSHAKREPKHQFVFSFKVKGKYKRKIDWVGQKILHLCIENQIHEVKHVINLHTIILGMFI